jgi:hypothetical protein
MEESTPCRRDMYVTWIPVGDVKICLYFLRLGNSPPVNACVSKEKKTSIHEFPRAASRDKDEVKIFFSSMVRWKSLAIFPQYINFLEEL